MPHQDLWIDWTQVAVWMHQDLAGPKSEQRRRTIGALRDHHGEMVCSLSKQRHRSPGNHRVATVAYNKNIKFADFFVQHLQLIAQFRNGIRIHLANLTTRTASPTRDVNNKRSF